MKSFLFLLLFIFLLACGEKERETDTIPIDLFQSQSLLKSDIRIIKHIPLESKEEALYSEIRKMYIADSSIYILDNKTENLKLYYFNIKGQYIRKTLQGNGPGEVLYPVDFFVSDKTKDVYLWDLMLNKMSVFDSLLNPKSHFFIKTNVPVYNLSRLLSGQWLIHKPTVPETQDKPFFFYGITDSSSFKNVQKYIFETPSDYYDLEMTHPISRWYDKNVKFVKPIGSKIYGLRDSNVYVAYHFDFSGLNVSDNEFETQNMRNLLIMGREGTKVAGISNVIETKNTLGFTIRWKDFNDYIIYDRKVKKYVTSIKLTQSGLLPKGKLMALDEDDNFVLVSNPMDFIIWQEEYGKEYAHQFYVKETDNDVLTFFNVNFNY